MTQTTKPMGATAQHILLMGATGSNKGAPTTKPLGAGTDGSLLVSVAPTPGYLTGRFEVHVNDQIVVAEGKLVAIFRADGTPAFPVPNDPSGA